MEKKYSFKMDIRKGLKLDYPDIFIPWNISEDELKKILGNKLSRVTKGYYTVSCKSLGGLEHELGFHFEPREKGVLKELEFFRKSYESLEVSFKEFQQFLENKFGLPTRTFPGLEGYPRYEWQFDDVKIFHFVFERFGPEEHLRIKNNQKNQE